MAELTPRSLRGEPILIERVFPAQKISFETQRERKAAAGQLLAPLGAYWKGRKPLILVRSIVLGSLLPQTDDHERDLEIFESLMGIDDESLARRALALNAIKPKDFASRIMLSNPWDFFSYTIKSPDITTEELETWEFPLDADEKGVVLRWRRDIDDENKLIVYRKVLETFDTYERKASLSRRPEEVDQQWLYSPIWSKVNQHYSHLGINAHSHEDLTEQLGILRYGHRPRVGDAFSGGGSIPFEAARVGCEVYASDLNPMACLLTWGALNIIGASSQRRIEIEKAQRDVINVIDKEITELGIEHDEKGNRAKAFLYCLEARCPKTGFLVPMAPSWVISSSNDVIARLIPDHKQKRFDIQVVSGVSAGEMKLAKRGTIKDGVLSYELDGRTYTTPIKTLRGDYRDSNGKTRNRVRPWGRSDFKPLPEDLFQERLYAIQWIKKESLDKPRKETFFASVNEFDLTREAKVDSLVAGNLAKWQSEGLVPDMEIEPGAPPRYQGKSLILNRGWKYWHQVFNPRHLLLGALLRKNLKISESAIFFARTLDKMSKLCRWNSACNKTEGVFSNQALNELNNWGVRSWEFLKDVFFSEPSRLKISNKGLLVQEPSHNVTVSSDIWITDPPYANAVMYHEITEFFIAWLRKNPPAPFDEWIWDSRRALAIKGSGDDFRRGMADTYRAMTEHMPDDGMQCVMFTHQDAAVWSDMIGIFWSAGLQVAAAWYIATETTPEFKKGGFVQGTVILMLRKRAAGYRAGFKQRILPAVRIEVEHQIETMMHLNDEVKDKMGESVFNDSDLQMAGYAAALKVLTAYTQIGGEDVTAFAMRPRQRGEVTVVDEIVQQAVETSNSLLVPEGIARNTWHKLKGIQRFYLRMMDMESTGASKLDNYQNFAKAFRVVDYTKVMANMTANKTQLKHVTDFASRDLTESTELGATWLGRLIIGLQQLLAETEPQVVIGQLQDDLPDFMEVRPLLIDMLGFMEKMAPEDEVRQAAEVLGARLCKLRALGQ